MRSAAFMAAAFAGAVFAWPWERKDIDDKIIVKILPLSSLPPPHGFTPITGSSKSASKPYYSTGSRIIYPTGSAPSGSGLSYISTGRTSPPGRTSVGISSGIFPPKPTAGTGRTGTGTGGRSGTRSTGVAPPSTTTITKDVTSTFTTFTTGVTTITNIISEFAPILCLYNVY